MTAFTIHDLRDRPEQLDRLAGQVWAAFWQHKDVALADIVRGFAAHLQPRDLPFTLLAERDGLFLGTVSLIGCDEPERDDLAPWLAALWVEPEAREQGIGAALVQAVVARCAALGIARLYLSARPAVQGFYEKRGWQVIDRDIGPARLAILERAVE